MWTFSHNYESDITREQFELIRPKLEGARKKKPGEIDLYSAFCTILCLVKAGYSGTCCPAISRRGG